jgi:hypothetical protein
LTALPSSHGVELKRLVRVKPAATALLLLPPPSPRMPAAAVAQRPHARAASDE